MNKYTYQLTNNEGLSKKGMVEGNSKEEVIAIIRKKGWYISELRSQKPTFLSTFIKKEKLMTAFERINFTDHLASLIAAGTPLLDAFEAYADDGEKRMEMIDNIIKDIERGEKLSISLAKYPKVFSSLYVSLVQSGEQAGNLDETLAYLATELRREYEFKQKVKSALFYPSLVLSVALMVIVLVVAVVMPKISSVIKSFGEDIPLTTRAVIALSEFLTRYGIVLLVIFVAFIILLIFLSKQKFFKEKLDEKILSVPLLGGIIKKYTLARLLRVISSGVKYGIPLGVIFSSVKDVTGNIKYREACMRMDKKIQKGLSLSQAFSGEGVELFPGLITRSTRGAERTGGLDMALSRLSTQYEIEVDRDLKRIVDLLEPVVVVILGLIVLGIAVSVVAPIYQMTSKIK